jgi:hypothetical protein
MISNLQPHRIPETEAIVGLMDILKNTATAGATLSARKLQRRQLR